VYVNARGQYLKLIMHRCHVNQANLFNQVGIIALNVIGHFTEIKNLSRGACISHDDRVDDLAFDFNVQTKPFSIFFFIIYDLGRSTDCQANTIPSRSKKCCH